jgi:hypothetical protein
LSAGRRFSSVSATNKAVKMTVSSTYANILKYHIQGMPTNILVNKETGITGKSPLLNGNIWADSEHRPICDVI